MLAQLQLIGIVMIDLATATTQPVEITLDRNESNTMPGANQTLSCFEMWVDGIKATKRTFDPVSDAVACFIGSLCCVATAVSQSEENNRPATRGNVLYANQERRNDAQEIRSAYAAGACLGDAVIDTAAIMIGMPLAGIRALGLFAMGNNQRSNPVCCASRNNIDAVDLASSCQPVINCSTTCCD